MKSAANWPQGKPAATIYSLCYNIMQYTRYAIALNETNYLWQLNFFFFFHSFVSEMENNFFSCSDFAIFYYAVKSSQTNTNRSST